MTLERKVRPVDLALAEGPQPNGTVFVVLNDLEKLHTFWRERRSKLPFAAGNTGEPNDFLNQREWVFGATKAAVVDTVTRWSRVGIEVVWQSSVESGHELFCFDTNSSVVKDWWTVLNLPGGLDLEEWFGEFSVFPDFLFEKGLSIGEAAEALKEYTFDRWVDNHADGGFAPAELFLQEEVDSFISQEMQARLHGRDYYGDTLGPIKSSAVLIKKAFYDKRLDLIMIELSVGQLPVPRKAIRSLQNATSAQLSNITVHSDGKRVVWPDLNVALTPDQFTIRWDRPRPGPRCHTSKLSSPEASF